MLTLVLGTELIIHLYTVNDVLVYQYLGCVTALMLDLD